jgi:hypothetical protein
LRLTKQAAQQVQTDVEPTKVLCPTDSTENHRLVYFLTKITLRRFSARPAVKRALALTLTLIQQLYIPLLWRSKRNGADKEQFQEPGKGERS